MKSEVHVMCISTHCILNKPTEFKVIPCSGLNGVVLTICLFLRLKGQNLQNHEIKIS